MNKDLPESIQSARFKNPIWGLLFSPDHSLVVDSRNETSKDITISKVNLDTLKVKSIDFKISWWEKLIGVEDECVYSIQYNDQNDPSNFQFRRFDLRRNSDEILEEQPRLSSELTEPYLYELNSDHHKTVAQFLCLELVLPCEYLEFDDKIIISYYLRSEKGFDRFLLLLKNGEKEWRVKQDSEMKGFASGSFFVVRGQLIFVRNRNEVCIYSF